MTCYRIAMGWRENESQGLATHKEIQGLATHKEIQMLFKEALRSKNILKYFEEFSDLYAVNGKGQNGLYTKIWIMEFL